MSAQRNRHKEIAFYSKKYAILKTVIMMGLIVKNTTYDSGEDILPVGAVVTIMETGEQAEVVMNFRNLYQVKKADGTIATYSRLELARS